MEVLTEQGCWSLLDTPECQLVWKGCISGNYLVALGRSLGIKDKETQESCHWEVSR